MSFCSLAKRITPKICRLCVCVLINKRSLKKKKKKSVLETLFFIFFIFYFYNVFGSWKRRWKDGTGAAVKGRRKLSIISFNYGVYDTRQSSQVTTANCPTFKRSAGRHNFKTAGS